MKKIVAVFFILNLFANLFSVPKAYADDFSFGSEAVLPGNPTVDYSLSVANLSSTKFIVAFRDGSDTNKGKAVIGTISGTSISYGSVYTFNAATSSYVSVTALSETMAFIAYRDGGAGGNPGNGIVANIAGDDTITYSTEFTFASADINYTSVTALDSTHVFISYQDGNDTLKGKGIVGTIGGSGTTVTYGTAATFNNAVYDTSVTMLSSTKVFIGYRESGNAGKGIIGTISGDSISYGTEASFNSGLWNTVSVQALSSTKVVIASVVSGTGYVVVGSISGTSITYGSSVQLSTGSFGTVTYHVGQHIAKLSETTVALAYADNGGSDYGKARLGTISGTSITLGTATNFNAASTSRVATVALSSSKFIITYQDAGNSLIGSSIVGTYAAGAGGTTDSSTVTAEFTAGIKSVSISGNITLNGTVSTTSTSTLTGNHTVTFDNPTGNGASTTSTVSLQHLTIIGSAQRTSGSGTITSTGNTRYTGAFATESQPYCTYTVTIGSPNSTYGVSIASALITENSACAETGLTGSGLTLTTDGTTKHAVGAKGVAFTVSTAPSAGATFTIVVHQVKYSSVSITPGALTATSGSSLYGYSSDLTSQTSFSGSGASSSDEITLFNFAANTGAGNFTKFMSYSVTIPKNPLGGAYSGTVTVTYT